LLYVSRRTGFDERNMTNWCWQPFELLHLL